MAHIELDSTDDLPTPDSKQPEVKPPTLGSQFTFTIDVEGWMVTPQGKRLRRTRFAADWQIR